MYQDRLAAAVALGSAALTPLSEWLDDSTVPVAARRFAVAVASGVGTDKVVPLLARMAWADSDPAIRNMAMTVLASMPFANVDPHILAALSHSEHQPIALMVLQSRKVLGADLVLLSEMGKSDTVYRRVTAESLLAQETPEAYGAVEKLWHSSDPRLQACSFIALLIHRGPEEPNLNDIWAKLPHEEKAWTIHRLDLARWGGRLFEFLSMIHPEDGVHFDEEYRRVLYLALHGLGLRRASEIRSPAIERFVLPVLVAPEVAGGGLWPWGKEISDPGAIVRAYGVERLVDALARTFESDSLALQLFVMEMAQFGDGPKTLELLRKGRFANDSTLRLAAYRNLARRVLRKDNGAVELFSEGLRGDLAPIELVIAGMESNTDVFMDILLTKAVSGLRGIEKDDTLVLLISALARRPWTPAIRVELHRLLRSCRENLCFQVLETLAATHDTASAPVVMAFVDRVSGALRVAAIRCLGELASETAIPILLGIIKNSSDPDRIHALDALNRIPSDSYCGETGNIVWKQISDQRRRGSERFLGRCPLNREAVEQMRRNLGAADGRDVVSAVYTLQQGRLFRSVDVEVLGDRLPMLDVRNLVAVLTALKDIAATDPDAVFLAMERINDDLVPIYPELVQSVIDTCCNYMRIRQSRSDTIFRARCSSDKPGYGVRSKESAHTMNGLLNSDCSEAPTPELTAACRRATLLRVNNRSAVGVWVEAARTWHGATRQWAEKRLRETTGVDDVALLCELLRLDHPMNPTQTMLEVLASQNVWCPAPRY